MSDTKAFTLIELLIVMGVIGIIASTVIVVLNPLELANRARDGKRFSELRAVNNALNLYEVDEGASFGSTSTVYISAPDTSATCANLTLPALSAGWSYNCVTSVNTRKIDGTGWVPVDFSSIRYGPPFTKLPIDPINTDTNELYYSYVTDGTGWELNSVVQSEKEASVASSDGGDSSIKFEVGKNLTLTP